MPTFAHPALLWGLLIVGLPVLIHLINMMRQRRVRWAAMEFLLVSQKKNRTWVLLKELLLLAARMAVIALVVLVVSQPRVRNQFGHWFGGSRTHHVVLLDDSFSMSDRWGDTSAMAEGKRVVERIGTLAARQVQPQLYTLLRFSQAGRAGQGTRPDLLKEQVTSEFPARLRQVLQPLGPSMAADGPLAALDAIRQLLGAGEGDRRIVYVVSDLRARQWAEPGDLRNRLIELNDADAEVHLIHCVDAARPNLAIADLRPGPGTRAAGVPLFMEVSVQNFGPAPVRDVAVSIEADGEPLPAVKITGIPAGKAVQERFPVHFSTAGEHRITARLESDVVAADNSRYCVVDFPAELPVLLVDGDPQAEDAKYVAAALSPGGPVKTGLKPRIERPRYLSVHPLEPFRAIYLLNLDRLDPPALQALEKYVDGGGGLALFLGPRTNRRFVNDSLYRDGKGLFPLPIDLETTLLVDRLQKIPDLEVSDHRIFSVLAGKENSFLPLVNVERYVAAAKGWQPSADARVQVLARLRNGAPLAVERNFGAGRVVAFLTTAAPTWNNWARNNPSFVVVMLELQAYLARQPIDVTRLVGSPLSIRVDPSQYESQVRFVSPDAAAPMNTVGAVPGREGAMTASLAATDMAGIYQARLARSDGKEESRDYAYNVEPAEGDLKIVTGRDLASRLDGVRYSYEQASLFEAAGDDAAGYDLTEMMLYLLVALLVGEQLLAWSASYHRTSAGGGR